MDRIEQWAELLVEYSMDIEENDLVQISFGQASKSLAKEVYRKVMEAGAYPVYSLDDQEFDKVFYEEADEDQLEHVPEYQRDKVKQLDASLRIRAPSNTNELSEISPKKMQQNAKAKKDLKEEIIENTKWSLTQYPTRALAQKAEMSFEDYKEFAIDACVKDWEEESKKYLGLKETVDEGSLVRIKGERTDIEFSIGENDGINRLGVLSDGTSNVPGGEVFTAPVVDSVEGEIYFEIPAVTGGREVEGVWLKFKDGRVVDYSAEKNEDLLEERLKTDDGSDRLGEFGIGTNFDIDRYTKNILLDEKMGGTIHLALGSAYRKCLGRVVDLDDVDDHGLSDERVEELADEASAALRDDSFDAVYDDCSSDEQDFLDEYRDTWEDLADEEDEQLNDSAVHWDMIKDLRETGELIIDGTTILEEGEFVGVSSL
jgi:aminopeptidase